MTWSDKISIAIIFFLWEDKRKRNIRVSTSMCWRQCYKTLPQKGVLVAIATILSKTFSIHFLFMSAVEHN